MKRYFIYLLAVAFLFVGCSKKQLKKHPMIEKVEIEVEEKIKKVDPEKLAEKIVEKIEDYVSKEPVTDVKELEPETQPKPTYKRTYTVRSWNIYRDCLWNIAEWHYGNPYKWKEIYYENTNIIDDPDLIYIGQVLTIP